MFNDAWQNKALVFLLKRQNNRKAIDEVFLPGFKSRYGNGWEKFSLLAAPFDLQLLQQWQQKISGSKRPFRAKDKLCERHFEKNLIFNKYCGKCKGNVQLDEKEVPKIRESRS